MKKISVDTGKSIEWLEDYFYNGLTGVDIKFYNLVNKKYELNLSLYPEKPHVHKREN